MNRLNEILDQARREKLFGTISLQFKGGTLVLIRREETLLPNENITNHPSSRETRPHDHTLHNSR